MFESVWSAYHLWNDGLYGLYHHSLITVLAIQWPAPIALPDPVSLPQQLQNLFLRDGKGMKDMA